MSKNSTLFPVKLRSTSVTVLAWLFIALFGFFAFIGVLYLRMGFLDNRNGDLETGLESLLISVFILITSIGLFKRCNWARWCSIGIIVLFIMSNLWVIFAASNDPWGILFLPFLIPFTALSVLLGWFITKLLSAPIKKEFGAD